MMRKASLPLMILFLVISPLLGDTNLLNFMSDETSQYIFTQIRIPRMLLAMSIGASLSLAGYVFQVLFRNPLATPYTLGVSSVAGFAIALSQLLLENSTPANKLFVFIVSFLPLALIMIFAQLKKMSRQRLLLVGVSLGIFSSSMIIFLQSMMGNESVSRLVRWMMGSLETVGYQDALVMWIIFIFASLIYWSYRKQITLISIGEIFAQARGVKVDRLSLLLVGVTNVLIAAVVWFCGPIGFVGLIIPHVVRKIYGNDFSKNFFVTIVYGAFFLVFADVINRVVSPDRIISIGAITALIGAPLLVSRVLAKN
jgi:iron complex transport system permease protein